MPPSEKERMIAGQPYRAGDAQLVAERKHVRLQLKTYNDSSADDTALRQQLIRAIFGGTGSQFEIEPPFRCDYGYNIRIGDHFYANFNCVILDCAPVTIGHHVFLGPGVQIYTATHPLNPQERNSGVEGAAAITIGDNVWIGGGTIINPGVNIGAGSTIGSGSVVTRDIPPNVVAAGNPCRVIRALGAVDA